ncbi:MAG: hypothetical protein SO164_06010 [Campylobacter sp.]|nr:hypothetical protein [Campylobacter sp.]
MGGAKGFRYCRITRKERVNKMAFGDSSRSTITPKSYGNAHGSVNYMFYPRRAHRRLLAY